MLKFCSKLLLRTLSRGNTKSSKRQLQRKFSKSIECVEERTLLSTFMVANTNDSGAGSLRQAILDANDNVGADTISFGIATGVQTIQPLSALPTIVDPVTIDGTTQTGFSGTPLIVLNGELLLDQSFLDGLVVDTTDSLIKGLVINGFSEGIGISVGGFGSSGVTGNTIEGCIIGLNAAGTAAVPNAVGIRVAHAATQNVIGGSGLAGNVISGNLGFGVILQNEGTTGNQILGNAIGTSADRTLAVGNGYGIGIGDGASDNDVGGVVAGEGNLISGNVNTGILITGTATSDIRVRGNRIGTNAAGTASLGDFTDSAGIAMSDGTHNNTIGGTTPAARNQIAGLSSDGIYIADAETHSHVIQGNYIGVSADGSTAVPNGGDGIFLVNSGLNIIGGETAGAGNVISGSARNGVTIFGSDASNNIVWGNSIGTNAAGSSAVPNGVDGIRIDGAANNQIGGTNPLRANLISGNTNNGVSVTALGATGNLIQGNLIGVAANASSALPNGSDGIAVDEGASNNLIGGSTTASWNTIAFNGFKGIEIVDATSLGNEIRGNRIHSNAFLAIDLNSDGVTANDPQDADVGPNGLQNFAVLSAADSVAGTLYISGTLNTKRDSTYTLEFYASPANDGLGNGQGSVPVGTLVVNSDTNGNVAFTAILTILVTPGQFVTATVTDSTGNTSEFSAAHVVGNTLPASPILSLPGSDISYALNQPAVVIDATASVMDADSSNFNTGKLTVSFDSKGERGEKLKVRNQGTASGQIGLKGTKVTFGGELIGKAKGGSGKKPLTVTFNSSATPAAVTALLKNITYVHTGDSTNLTTRHVRFQMTDGAGHTSNSVTKVITLTALM